MGMQMQIGCQMAFNDFTSPAYIAEAAQFVEDFGFTEFWVPEHVMFFQLMNQNTLTQKTEELAVSRGVCWTPSAP